MKDPILITGGAGFIGSHIAAKLAARGREVHVLDPAADLARLPAGVTVHTASILNEPALHAAVAGKRTVFHLAAKATLWARDPRVYEQVNHQGTRTLLNACAAAGVERVVVTSTALVLRDWRRRYAEPVSEAGPRPPLAGMPGPYSRSKWRAEQAGRKAAAEGLPTVLVYPTAPIGPPADFVTEPTDMLKQFLKAPPPAYLEMRLNLPDVDDVAEAHILAAERAAPGARYLLAGEDVMFSELLAHLEHLSHRRMPRRRIPYTLAALSAHLGERMAKVTGRPPAASIEGVRSAKQPPELDASAARADLDWRPRSVSHALERTVRAIRTEARE